MVGNFLISQGTGKGTRTIWFRFVWNILESLISGHRFFNIIYIYIYIYIYIISILLGTIWMVWTPKKVPTLFPLVFFVKTDEIICEYFRNRNISKKYKYPLADKSNISYSLILWYLSHTIGWFWVLGIIKPSNL